MTISSLSAENLTCARGGKRLFAGLSFRVEQGQALCIEGPNGAGKTSLLRLIAGFLAPVSGSVRFTANDKSEIIEAEARGKEIGWLGHQDGLKAQLTVVEQLSFFARLYERPANAGEEKLVAVLAEVGLARQGGLPCRYLSAGQKKRLALARLKIGNRSIWLLDEPLAALDASGKALAAKMIADHCAGGGIVLAATHEPLGLPAAILTLGGA